MVAGTIEITGAMLVSFYYQVILASAERVSNVPAGTLESTAGHESMNYISLTA